jgi:hypothetical protein
MYAGVDPNNGDALYYKADKTTTNDDRKQLHSSGQPNPIFMASK